LTAAETARLQRAIDPVSIIGTPESQRAAEGNVVKQDDFKGDATKVAPESQPPWQRPDV
jgi:hypothetical protein